MPLKLYGFPIATCTRRVMVVLEEKQVPYEFVVVDVMNSEHKTPEYLDKHPFGKIPYLDDDGFIVYESRAISHYIATKYANQGTPDLVPAQTDTAAFTHYLQATSVEQANFNPYAETAVAENVFKPAKGQEPSQEVFEKNVKSLEESLDGYERILGKQKFLAGNTVTLADLYHLPYGSLLGLAGAPLLEDEIKRPNVARWWKDISTRPSWKKLAYGPGGPFGKPAEGGVDK